MERILFIFFPDLCDGEDFKVLYTGMGSSCCNPCVDKVIALNCPIELFSDHITLIAEYYKYGSLGKHSTEEIAYWDQLAELIQRTEDDLEAPKSLYRKAVKVCGIDIEPDQYIFIQWMSI